MYINNDIDYMKYLKNKKIIIFGAGDCGKRLCIRLQKHHFNVIGFCDNDKNLKSELIVGQIRCFGNVKEAWEQSDSNTVLIVSSTNYRTEMKKELLEIGIPFITDADIDFSDSDIQYYDEVYFERQKKIGAFGGKINCRRFSEYIRPEDTVLEFGSGGGYLLKALCAKKKLGIEINKYARENAAEIGINSVSTVDEVEDDFADVIISTHVLEHIEEPFATLKKLRMKLKDNGKIIFVVPYECNDNEYRKNDVDQHLYIWNSACLGNLFKKAGYFVNSVECYEWQWPYSDYEEIFDAIGEKAFGVLSGLFGAKVHEKNIMIVATK